MSQDLNSGVFFDVAGYYVPLIWNTVVGVVVGSPEYILAAVFLAYFVRFLFRLVFSFYRKRHYRKIIEKTRQKRDEALEEYREAVMSVKEEVVQLIKGDPEVLRQKLQAGEVTALEAVKASLHISLEANLDDNSVVAVIPGCLEAALKLDEKRRAGEPCGPLFGMPFSVKENFMIEGENSTLGQPSFVDRIATSTSALVQVLVSQDAVPIVRTNIPQTLLTFECSNPLYGETNNPRRGGRSCGGSSGGEASLHARGAVPFGLGTDVGGSVRIPAHFCGTAAFKPTSGRLSGRWISESLPGQVFVKPTPGAMAPTVSGVILAMKGFFGANQMMFDLDNTVPPIPLDESVINSKEKLRFGVFSTDGDWFMPPLHACSRAVDVARQVLEKQGHECVVLPSPDIEKWVLTFYALMTADKGATLIEMLGDNPIDDRVAKLFDLVRVPNFAHNFMKYLPQNKLTKVLSHTGEKSVKQLWQRQHDAISQVFEFSDLMAKHNVDVILFPSSVVPAALQGHCTEITPAVWPTFVFNMLNLPAGIVPVTRVLASDDDKTKKLYVVKDGLDTKMKNACFGSEGLPVTVQIIGKRWRDEMVLRAMREVDEGVRSMMAQPTE